MTALDKLRKKLQRLAEAFAKELPGRVSSLEDAVTKARAEGEHAEALLEARAVAHRMKGTAGTFGFAEVSAKASEIEATADGMLQEKTYSAVDPRWDSIQARLGSLRRLAEQVATRQEGA